MRIRKTAAASFIAATMSSAALFSQQTPEPPPADIVAKIKEEGLERSKVMETVSYLTDVHGPRLTGSPITKTAGEWTKQRLAEWGLENAHLESWGPFGRGWTLEAFTANMVEPAFSPLIGYPKAWSPSTPRTIRGEPILLEISKEEDFEKYRGKLLRSIVMISSPREVKALFDPPATRQSTESLLNMANADPATRRRSRFGGPGGPGGGPGGPGGGPGGASGGPPSATSNSETRPTSQPPADASASRSPIGPEGRASMTLQSDKFQFAYTEGAAVIIEPGRGDGGTVFVSQATLPRRPESSTNRGGSESAPFGMGRQSRTQPWSAEAAETLPQIVMSVEHYNRVARMLQRGAHPILEVDIGSKFYSDDLNSFNIIAEIPGTDLKDEIVMLGAHFDSWHAGTGATDNGIGCAVAMEAVRILKAIDAKPRRTIRIGLWTGEEQGLLGSKAYVTDHFGKLASSRESQGNTEAASSNQGGSNREGGSEGRGGGSEGRGGGGGGFGSRGRLKYEIKPEHEKLSAYFNLDNGAGKIRGIYLQGNESLRATFRTWLSPFAEMGASTVTVSNTGGTDHLSFDSIGLPGFQFIQDPLEYDTRTHHSSMDVFERVQPEDAKQASIIMATFVYQTAMLNEKLPRKPLDGEIVTAGSSAQVEAKPIIVPGTASATEGAKTGK
ncbi:MAG: M28 family peptidase [Pirellula sp.]